MRPPGGEEATAGAVLNVDRRFADFLNGKVYDLLVLGAAADHRNRVFQLFDVLL